MPGGEPEPGSLTADTVHVPRPGHADYNYLIKYGNKASSGGGRSSSGPSAAAPLVAALEEFGAERIQHGIRAMGDPDVVARLAEEGVACDVCPGSNLALAAVPSLDVHPLPAMLDAGITVTLGSDDPPLFATSLLGEYENAWNLCDLDEDGLRDLAINSLVESFASTDQIEAWLDA